MAGSDDLGKQSPVSTRPPTQHAPGELPDHLPAVAHNPGPLAWAETLAYQAYHALLGHHQDIMGALNHALLRLEAIQLALTGSQAQDMESWEYLSAAPLPVDYRGRRHLLIWSPVAVAGVTMEAHGNTRSVNLASGWNVVDPPRDARLSYANGPIMLLYRATDDVAPQYV